MSPFRQSRVQQNPWVDDGANVPADAQPDTVPAEPTGTSSTTTRAAAGPTTGVPAASAPRRANRGAAAVGTVASGVVTLSRIVLMVAGLIAVLIGLAILLRDVDANSGNTIVKGVHDGANFFAGAFTGLATFHGHPKRAITIDWGIAALAYLAAGVLVAAVVRRVGRNGLAWQRDHSGAGVTT
jgi:hypothetical protein